MNYYYYQDAEVRAQIDELLQQNATIQANLGTESTAEERAEAKRQWMELAKKINEKTVIKWLPSAKVVDTFYVDGETVYVYNDAPVDTNAILTHYLTQAATYIDTIRDSSLQAVILDTIFRNSIVARDFRYKILRPIEIQKIDNSDRFQFHVLGGTGSQTDMDSIFKLRLSGGIMMEFKTGTSLIVRYDHTVGSKNPHGFEVMAAQRLRLRKR